jgi:hypothetical protein
MLIISAPELRARALDQLATALRPFAQAVAERIGRGVDDPAVRALTPLPRTAGWVFRARPGAA